MSEVRLTTIGCRRSHAFRDSSLELARLNSKEKTVKFHLLKWLSVPVLAFAFSTVGCTPAEESTDAGNPPVTSEGAKDEKPKAGDEKSKPEAEAPKANDAKPEAPKASEAKPEAEAPKPADAKPEAEAPKPADAKPEAEAPKADPK
jgi:hypothetical protein